MQLLVYLLIYPLLLIISILPFRIFYLLSDIVCFLTYDVIGYRKKVVRNNIKLALPHLSDKERLAIEKKFYVHLCDMFLEMIKTISISQKEMEKRFTFSNMELYYELEKKNKSIALMCAHYASYEWVISMNYYINHKGYGIYKKLANPHFDKLVKRIRSKFKAELIPTKNTIPIITENYKNNVLSIYGFASDQSPRPNSAHHWTSFMGHVVPVHTGAEMLAKRFDMNVIFLKVKKIKRGYYEASFEVLSDDVTSVPNYEITDKFLKLVEEQIHEAPEFYFWTHKRWKNIEGKLK
ncbi:lysophospholipid acyltransferase family protein [Flavobacterium sp.]|jgi:Kdo2-lipid IVA lauroyltransferase/acyltransferase|uniref:lysophospholipid acyltransferase family protein n=1 Tax=Flavobacterium sp. TaxID=239 RepID=UPI002769C4A4|nr:lysophospholipid acyltransferase family protein [Flavobacterium sp.]MDP5028053.1 lysophospholipid acyltransferase family protein [Flavobacterium sp.]